MRRLIASFVRRLGVVDIGSNTIRMVVYERQASGAFRLQDDLRQRVRLGAGLARSGVIEAERLAQATALLERFADYAAGLDVLEAIGTSALRDAENGRQLIDAAHRLGIEIRVLTGAEEAQLAVLAVANGFDFDDAWVIDLGGGSAQVARMEGRRLADGDAYPLGAVRLTEAYLAGDPPTPAEVRALEAAVASQLAPLAAAMRASPPPLVAIGGTVRNLARAAQRRRRYPLGLLHGYRLTRDDLEALTGELLARNARQRAAMAGIHPDRADVIVAGALVFRWLLRHGRRDGLVVSGDGVREGALYRRVLLAPHLVARVAEASVESLVVQHGVDRQHAAQVRRLAAALFDRLEPLHGLGPRDAVLLDAAAALYDVGLSVHFYRRHRHGAMLLRAAALDGFSHREQTLLMLLVRHHRKGDPKPGRFGVLLRDGDRQRLRRLVALLRLAIALDRSRRGRIRELAVRIKKKSVVLELPAIGDASIELWSARQHAAYVSRVLGRRLKLKAGPAAFGDGGAPRPRP